MSVEIIVIGILCMPLILGLLFRVSSSHLFFSVMAGDLLGRFWGEQLDEFIHHEMHRETAYGEVILLIAPSILTALFLKGTLSKGKTLLHALPLVITGVVLAAFVLPVLPNDLQTQVGSTFIGGKLIHLHHMIIGAVVLLQLIVLWIFNHSESVLPHHKKHKK